MLNRIVPTPLKIVPAAKVFAFTANTSRSGSVNGTEPFQVQPSESTQLPPTRFTMIPVNGAAACAELSLGPGIPVPTPPPPQVEAKLSGTAGSASAVVWLPDWNAAT
jgi:hypothetical protein